MAHDHEQLFWLKGKRGFANVFDQRFSVEAVQNLRPVGSHAGAESGGEYQNIQRLFFSICQNH
jgi:hypothetical protein